MSHPWLIAHRGASALRPEHTLAAYALAIEHGADAIEPDLVITRDGVLVARHENALSGTTDVASRPAFAARRTGRQIDDTWVEDWFTEDFTLAELKTLRAVERLPQLRSTAWDGQFEIPTFDEVIALVAAASATRDGPLGLVPELKHSTYFAGQGLALEPPLLQALAAHDITRRAPVVIQSFETANLRALRAHFPRGGSVRLLQLLGAPEELREIATYADAIGCHFNTLQIAPRDDAPGYRSARVDAAHAAGLQVFAYTFRPENGFLDAGFRNDGPPEARNEPGAIRQLQAYVAAGVDAMFVDDPALGRRALSGRPLV